MTYLPMIDVFSIVLFYNIYCLNVIISLFSIFIVAFLNYPLYLCKNSYNNEKTYQKRRRGNEDPLESQKGIH
jgi:hypothetical protein